MIATVHFWSMTTGVLEFPDVEFPDVEFQAGAEDAYRTARFTMDDEPIRSKSVRSAHPVIQLPHKDPSPVAVASVERLLGVPGVVGLLWRAVGHNVPDCVPVIVRRVKGGPEGFVWFDSRGPFVLGKDHPVIELG